MSADRRQLRRSAARLEAELSERARRAAVPGFAARGRRAFEFARQAVARKGALLLREHWDVAVFDVVFGCLKAFGIYPALYFAGLAWTIPVMEYAPLNTQLWTAGYLLARAELVSQLGSLRFGRPLKQLDALRDQLLGAGARPVRALHRFELGGRRRVLRVQRSRFAAWRARCRGEHQRGVVTQSELRALVRDREFLFLANPLRANPYLYEEVLLARLASSRHARSSLLALSAPEEQPGEEARALLATLDESREPALARLTEQARALARALRPLGRAGRALRRAHASLRRAAERELRALDGVAYRLLADRADGVPLRASPHWRALCCKRAEIRAAIARAGRVAAWATDRAG